MDVKFVNPVLLYLLWLAPAMAVWWFAVNRRREKGVAAFVSAAMQKKLRPSASASRFNWQAGLFSAGLLLLLVAAARPQWGTREETVYQRGRDVIIALDVSRSMLATDVHPNRLDRAKADILDLIKELRGDRAALLAFRRTAVLLCPLTTDYAYLRQALDAVGIDSAPLGETNIGDAIDKAIDGFEPGEGSHKAIILISDGEDLSGKALAAATRAAEQHIPIFTVGLGSRSGSSIPDENGTSKGNVTFKGETVITKLNHETLYAIANKTGGAYIPVETASLGGATLGTLYRDYLRQVSARDLEETLQRRYIERYQYFLIPGLLLLLAATFLSQGRLAVGMPKTHPEAKPPRLPPLKPDTQNPAREPAADASTSPQPRPWSPPRPRPSELSPLQRSVFGVGCSVFVWVASVSFASTNNLSSTNSAPISAEASPPAAFVPPGREGARQAQNLYLLGRYEDAARAYLLAAAGAAAGSQHDFRYNAAVAQYKAGNYRKAADTLKELALMSTGSAPDVFMGLGESYFRAFQKPSATSEVDRVTEKENSLRDAGEAYREAARVQSESGPARRNLEVVLQALPEAAEQARLARLTSRYAQTPAGQLAGEMLANQRKIVTDAASALTNASPSQVKQLEDIARRQNDNADLWVPLKGKLMEAMQQQPSNTNLQQQMAMINQSIELTRDRMKGTASFLRDLNSEGYPSAEQARNSVYQFWKAIAPFDLILTEDILRQTNIITRTVARDPSDPNVHLATIEDQKDAEALTRLFIERFTAQVPEGGLPAPGQQQPPGNTQKLPPSLPPAGPVASAVDAYTNATAGQAITPETRKKILALADQAAGEQQKSSAALSGKEPSAALSPQREAHRILKEIESLLPKNEQKNQQQEQQQQEQKDQKQDQKQDQKNEQKQEQQQEQKQEQQEEKKEQPQEQQDPKEDKDRKDMSQDDVHKLLEKAIQREKEHDAEKRRMNNQYIPPSQVDRDW